jgi:hypothetical protein
LPRASRILSAALGKSYLFTKLIKMTITQQLHKNVNVLRSLHVLIISFNTTLNPRLRVHNRQFPLLRFRSALHCGYSGITDIQGGLFFVLTRARTFKKS